MTLNCQYDELSQTAVTVSTYANVTADSPSQMKAALVQQPLAVGIEADKMAFQTYTSGVLSGSACGTNLDHAVLVVGDGTEDGQDYWLVKNSWNTTWGDQGYIKLAKDSSTGTCGVQMEPQAPTTKSSNAAINEVENCGTYGVSCKTDSDCCTSMGYTCWEGKYCHVWQL